MILAGKRLLITGVITKDSIAFHAAALAQEQGAEVLLTSFGRVRRMTERAAARLPQPVDVLERTFSEIGRYDDFVLVRDIAFNSHCEHHMMPFMGKAHIAYKPVDRVVGLSKLARLVDVYVHRLLSASDTLEVCVPGYWW